MINLDLECPWRHYCIICRYIYDVISKFTVRSRPFRKEIVNSMCNNIHKRIEQTWQNKTDSKTSALTINKSVVSSLLGVARFYLIIIADNASRKFRANRAVSKSRSYTVETSWCGLACSRRCQSSYVQLLLLLSCILFFILFCIRNKKSVGLSQESFHVALGSSSGTS